MERSPHTTTDRRTLCLAALLIALTVALLFLQAPDGGAFYWSDAPRHALNGVFVKDLLADRPWDDAAAYAYSYYAQYPALTILFYPPLFYVISAPFYLLLGVSHEVSLLVVYLHYVLLGLGCFVLARFWLDTVPAMAVALTVLCLPEIAFWGRQVMLEVPAYAFLVWSAVAFVSHMRGSGGSRLYWAAAMLVLALYTKISVAYVGAVYLVLLLQRDGLGFFLRKRHYIVAALTTLSLVPLMVLSVKFGQANVQSVTGVADSVASRTDLEGWLWYLQQIPEQTGWAVTALSAWGLLMVMWPAARRRMPLKDGGFWALWFGLGYVFFSAIDLKEARHSVFLLLPLVFLSVHGLASSLPRRCFHAGLALMVLATAAQTWWWRPVYYVDGYADAADYVAEHAPRDSVVLFSGYRDGAFIFNMREREVRNDLSVLRADKMLLSLAVRRELGVEEKPMTEAQLAQLINDSGVHYVVMQPGFWTDLEAMRRFERVMASDQFIEVARIPTPANHDAHEKELVILRNRGPVGPKPDTLNIELKIINRHISAASP